MVFRWLWPAVVLLVSACSQDRLLTKQDYQQRQNDFMQGDAAEALCDFPRRTEQGDFITTMEQGYLNLNQGKPQIDPLQRQADLLQDRVRYNVSREAKAFFYLQTPEDYDASEHEVIWLHFLLSWGYSLQGKYEDACVEARIAGSLLTLPWSPNGHFDDPAMRLFLAGLWTMCSEWQEAQVDLRAAWFMDHSLTWAGELADRESPPANLFVVLGGPGRSRYGIRNLRPTHCAPGARSVSSSADAKAPFPWSTATALSSCRSFLPMQAIGIAATWNARANCTS